MNNISLAAYFAAHAPEEIPEWFEAEGIRPNINNLPTGLTQDLAADWVCNWSHTEMRAFLRGRSFKASNTEYDALIAFAKLWNDSDKVRYFAWRKFYGEKMAAEFAGTDAETVIDLAHRQNFFGCTLPSLNTPARMKGE